jgi:hypothetical protein
MTGFARLFAETILVSVSETEGGAPLPAPQPVREGVLNGLFEAGHIVFDGPGGSGAALPELLEQAAAAGARFLLRAEVAFDRRTASDGPPTIWARGSFTLTETGTGRSTRVSKVSGGNQGREKKVDLRALGFEIGASIAAAAAADLAGEEP